MLQVLTQSSLCATTCYPHNSPTWHDNYSMLTRGWGLQVERMSCGSIEDFHSGLYRRIGSSSRKLSIEIHNGHMNVTGAARYLLLSLQTCGLVGLWTVTGGTGCCNRVFGLKGSLESCAWIKASIHYRTIVGSDRRSGGVSQCF